jgi:hypothetical protein
MTDKLIGYLVFSVFGLAVILIAIQTHELRIENQQKNQLLKIISNLKAAKYDR